MGLGSACAAGDGDPDGIWEAACAAGDGDQDPQSMGKHNRKHRIGDPGGGGMIQGVDWIHGSMDLWIHGLMDPWTH